MDIGSRSLRVAGVEFRALGYRAHAPRLTYPRSPDTFLVGYCPRKNGSLA